MKVGISLGAMHSIESNEAMLQLAEACGMDSVWLPDHMLGIVPPEMWPEFPASAMVTDPDSGLDPFCVAAILGRSTSLPIGTCVTDATRRRAADLARTTLTLHNSNKGGFILGIGSGEAESLLPFGYEFKRPVANLEQAAIELRALLDTGRMPAGVGRMGLPLENALGRPQVWIAGTGPRTLDIAGRYGDGWLSTPIKVELYAEQYRQVVAAAQAVGRKAPVGSLMPLILLGDSRDQVAGLMEAQPLVKLIVAMLASGAVWQKYGLDHPAGNSCRGYVDTIPHLLDPTVLRQVAPRIPLRMVDEMLFYGNAKDVAAQLKPYEAAGLGHVALCDMSGLAYTPEELPRVMGQLGELRRLLAA